MTNPADPRDTTASRPKQIETLPPLQVLRADIVPSPRTGEPLRPAAALVALVVFQVAAAGVAVAYGLHWWAAVHPETYPASARLIEWAAPPPGKWLALTLEGALAVIAAIVAAACGVAGFQAWNGWRWSRWAALVAVALTGALTAVLSWWGLLAAVPALVGTACLFLPRMTRFFREFAAFRSAGHAPYRRPERIFYGRLPRFR
ncbi:hypothetical protein [Tessaracoccus antarcticus]|uniref:Uncharacterized protein n=1 Tax=Tessaracoccus antarcticus TaxID=2479848 RepID=A0A3M0GBW2_9ACTN|nr:hypothetical protein [Tessaracoccus antarcticus]RMB61848.1 hypothetical protein EAX62_04375 [Tessaracoccus antarcticus]